MADAPEKKKTDVVFLHSPTEDGEGVRVIRATDDRVEAGEVRPMKEGRPITGDVVKLVPRETAPRVCDVEVLAKVTPDAEPEPKKAGDRHGPAQVATRAYRESWERIFGEADDAEHAKVRALN